MADETGHKSGRKPGPQGVVIPHAKAWRDAVVLTQTELARRAGVGRSTVARAEMGEPVSRPNARKLAEALGVPVLRLLHEAPPEDADTKDAPAA